MRWIGQITYDEVSYFREDVIIEADNKLGIGTFSPSEKLHVVGDALITGDSLADAFKPAAAGEPIKFKNFGGTERARILDGGNVGIGTTSPAAVLHAYATTGIVSESPSNASITIRRNDNTNYGALLKYHTGNSEKWVAGLSDAGDFTDSTGVEYFIGTAKTAPKFLINSSGNVGIGTTSPSERLHVRGGNIRIDSNSSGGQNLQFRNNGTANAIFSNTYNLAGGSTSKTDFNAYVYGDNQFSIWTNSNNRLTVLGGGNVGIGTSSPGVKLDVDGQIRSDDSFLLQSGTTAIGSIRNQGGALDIRGDSTRDVSLGSVTNPQALFVEGTNGNVGIGTTSPTQALHLPDSKQIALGTGADLKIQHNGTNSEIGNSTGQLNIYNHADNSDINFMADDGSGGITNYFVVDGSAEQTRFYKDTRHTDGIKANFGNADDLQIYHDGSNSFIKDTGTGDLYIDSSINFFVRNQANGEVWIKGTDEGVSLRYKDNQKIITTNTGIDVTGEVKADSLDIDGVAQIDGTLTVGVDDTGHDVKFYGATSGKYLLWDESQDRLEFTDATYAAFGTDGDMLVYHTGTDGFITEKTGHLYIRTQADDKDIILQSDDGSGGTTAYLTLDGSAGYTTAQKNIRFADDVKAEFGNDGDLKIDHDSSGYGYVQNMTGHLYLANYANDKDIIFQSDDGSGGVETYFFLDGSLSGGNPYTVFPDDSILTFGNSQDLQIKHSSSYSYIDNTAGGDLVIRQFVDDKDIIFQSDDGSGGVETYFFLDGSTGVTTFPDDKRLTFGTDLDLFLYHTGGTMNMKNYTGNMTFTNNANDKDIIFQSDDGSGGVETYFFLDGSSSRTVFPDSKELVFGTDVNLLIWHNATDSLIQNYTSGDLYIDQRVDDKDLVFRADDGSGGTTPYLTLDGGLGFTTIQKKMRFADNIAVTLGAADDLSLFHDGTNSSINNYVGNLTIDNGHSDKDIIFKGTDGGADITALTLDMSAAGKAIFNSSISIPDAGLALFGTGGDLQINHDGSNSYINHVGTGHMYIQNTTDDKDIILRSDDGSGGVTPYLTLDGSAGHTVASKEIQFLDNVLARFGTGNDLSIYHTGTSTLFDNNVGDMMFRQYADDKDIIFQSDDGSGGVETYFFLDGSLGRTVFPDNSRLVFGSSSDFDMRHYPSNGMFMNNMSDDFVISNYADDKDIIFKSDDGSGGVTAYLTLDGSVTRTIFSQEARFTDNVNLKFGSGGDMMMYHDGSNSYIDHTGTGDLLIRQGSDDGDIKFVCDNGSGGVATYLTLDGGLGHTTIDKRLRANDNVDFTVGTGNDLRLIHDGTHSYMTNYTGDFYIANHADDKDIIFQSDDGSGGLATYITLDGRNEEVVFSKPIVTAETQIKILPHQFMSNEDGGANKSAQFRDDTIIGVRSTADDSELYAFVEIPYGKTATNVTVYGNDASLAVNVYESDINAGALTDKTPGAGCVVGDVCDITDVAYSATNYLAIKVTTVSYTNDIVYGAVVTIT